MAKFIYIYKKKGSNWKKEHEKIQKILGGKEGEVLVKKSPNEWLYSSATKGLEINDWDLQTGKFSKDPEQFTFRLHVSDSSIELTPDPIASRTIWYYSDDEQAIISSSQRVIIALLGDFQLNTQAISWMLCTGCLGPYNSWDRRIKLVEPCLKVEINKQTLEIQHKQLSSQEVESELADIFEHVFSSFQSEESMGITLSGGWDSRATALQLAKNNFKCPAYTWGIKGSIEKPGTDANIARIIARKLDIPFKFIPLDESESMSFLEKFVEQSEGRIDHVNSFSDGFEFWEELNSEGITTIIRADEAFGWLRVSNEQDTRISLDFNRPSDYENVENLFKLADLPRPKSPKILARKTGESLATWRDRLYRNYRIPCILAALQDPMLSYVEIVNPLLHHKFIHWSTAQPDAQRTNKSGYKRVIKPWMKSTQTASVPSIPEVEELLANQKNTEEIKAQLKKRNSYFAFNQLAMDYLMEGLYFQRTLKVENPIARKIKSLIPFKLKKMIRNHLSGYQLGKNRMAFRGYIVMKMMDIIENDLK